MKESTTYQAIIQEGRVEGRAEGALAVVLYLGRVRFGPPTPESVAAIQSIETLERAEALVGQVYEVASWDELIALI